MENMKMQYECGAMSRQTIIDKSPYTTDTALELQRIEDEAKKDAAKQETISPVVDTENQETDTEENVSEEQDIEVDDKVN